MPHFDLTVLVEFSYRVEADRLEDAEDLAWEYKNFLDFSQVKTVEVKEIN